MDRVVADKVAAVFEDHNGKSSTRYRDLVDLYLLQAQVGFDSLQLRETLRAEMGRRNLQVPGEFKVPNETEWSRGWSVISAEDLPLLRSVKFKVGLTAVKRFIDPVLIGGAEGRWDPTQGCWT